MINPDNEIVFSTKEELSSHEKTWEKLKYVLLHEKKCKMAIYSVSSSIWQSGKGKTLKTIQKSLISRDLWGERDE